MGGGGWWRVEEGWRLHSAVRRVIVWLLFVGSDRALSKIK